MFNDNFLDTEHQVHREKLVDSKHFKVVPEFLALYIIRFCFLFQSKIVTKSKNIYDSWYPL